MFQTILHSYDHRSRGKWTKLGQPIKKNQNHFHNNQFFYSNQLFYTTENFLLHGQIQGSQQKRFKFFFTMIKFFILPNVSYFMNKSLKNIFIVINFLILLKIQKTFISWTNGCIYSIRTKCCLASNFLHQMIIKKISKKFVYSNQYFYTTKNSKKFLF